MKNYIFRHWYLSSIFILIGAGTIWGQSEMTDSEKVFMQTTQLEREGKFVEASHLYRTLAGNQAISEWFRPLILTREAITAYQAGDKSACLEAIGKLKNLEYLPEHDRLWIQELQDLLAGKRPASWQRTPKPVAGTKTALKCYVDMNQKEGGDGSLHKPFVTVDEALNRIRDMRKSNTLTEGAIEIVLKGDQFSVPQTIKLTNEDSGTERNPLVIRGESSQRRITLSGGIALTRWQIESDPAILERLPESVRGKVLRVSLKEQGLPQIDELVLGGFSSQRREHGIEGTSNLRVPELFYQGKAQMMARWPNEGDVGLALDGFSDDRPLRWADETDLWLHGYWCYQWADAYEKVKRIDKAARKIELEPPLNNYGFKDSQWHALNALSEIDQPGEYHLDIANQVIRLLPPDGFDRDACVLSAFGPVMTAKQCHYLTVCDLDLEYIRGDGIIFNDCDHITMVNCTIRAASGDGVIINGGSGHLLHSVEIEHMGRGGMVVNSGDWQKLIPSGTIIENCQIRDLSRIDRTYTPALVANGMGLRVRHNRFSEIPSSAIRVGCSESVFELNEFFDCVSESDDQGVFDTWGNPVLRGNVIRRNWFHDIKGRHGMVAGVRLDDAISGFMINDNIFERVGGGRFGGVQIHGGKHSFVENNLFVDCPLMFSHSGWGQKRWLDMLANHSAISNNMKTTPWQSEEWQRRYPMLKFLMGEPADQNFIGGNRAIHCGELYRSMSNNVVTFANELDKQEKVPSTLEKLMTLLPNGAMAMPVKPGVYE